MGEQHLLSDQPALQTGSMRSSSMSDPSSSRNAAWEPITNSVAPEGTRKKMEKRNVKEKQWGWRLNATVEYALIYKLYVYNKNYSALTSLPRTQKTAAPAPANQNTGRETAPARLIWWGTVSSLPGWQENYIFNNIKKVREVPCNKFNLYSQVAKQTYSFDLHFRNIS